MSEHGEMRRIAIVGPGGAGKSTLARRMGERLGLPVHHLDALHWRPGWVETPIDEWRQVQRELVRGERWIMDGNYGGTVEIRLAAADTIVFLDFPRRVALWRAFKRRLRYRGRSRPDMAEGCPEQLSPEFVLWLWNWPKTSRPKLIGKIEKHGARVRRVVLRSPAEVERFLASLPAADG